MLTDTDLYFYVYVLIFIVFQENKDVLENALHVALKGGRTEFVQLLLDRDYGADVSLKSYLTINRLRELHQENVSKHICKLWHNKKHPDFVLRNADTPVKVTVLPFIYATCMLPWSEHLECADSEIVTFWIHVQS